MRRCLPILVMLPVLCSGPIQPRPMAMERHPGAPFMISVREFAGAVRVFGI